MSCASTVRCPFAVNRSPQSTLVAFAARARVYRACSSLNRRHRAPVPRYRTVRARPRFAARARRNLRRCRFRHPRSMRALRRRATRNGMRSSTSSASSHRVDLRLRPARSASLGTGRGCRSSRHRTGRAGRAAAAISSTAHAVARNPPISALAACVAGILFMRCLRPASSTVARCVRQEAVSRRSWCVRATRARISTGFDRAGGGKRVGIHIGAPGGGGRHAGIQDSACNGLIQTL